ncbi:RDD family protein [Kitasatospora kazusensis]|uniref:RDD family protein n=1 Tax=Kitasatospora kazusensis TaxID=407974 RepID=A0ABN2ZLF3_9ACTN
MSSYDPSGPAGPEPEGGGKPSFDKPPPAGTPSGGASDPYGAPPPPPPPPPQNGSPYDAPRGYGAPYGAPPPVFGSPFASQGAPYAPGGGPVPGMPPLGRWGDRIIALLIDYVMVQVLGILIVLPFASLGARDGWVGAIWLGYGIYLVYDGLMLSRDGQTIGKKVMNLRVAMLLDGSPPTGAVAWTRAVTFVLPALVCCGIFWWLVDGLFGVFDKPYRQCIHDKAAKTVVVSTV